VVDLDGHRGAFEDGPVDGEVTLYEGLLEHRGEVEAVRAARVVAVAKNGDPFVLAGSYL
jgi:hypothetical protein